ncbi:hypothetical protein [Paraburkholderia tropica]|uniref:hypothetical protein n=1 Tax=Paraburkholderia tropica TaxID=92647 RepID=UPI0007ECCB10|nr:hypothetical protein [Paraburkholderia tropica]OBR53966.1 hypothetical protein A6456_21775 [Paraburkholderia tropica]
MLDGTDIQELARKHGVSGDPAAIVALVRAVEHLTVGAIVARAAIGFANPRAIMSDASKAVGQLEGPQY